jgi:pyruvate dehydrogenase E2 component (dihydrolipoamide acetyltransferase)
VARGDAEIEEATRAQQTAARRVAESKATIPHIQVDTEVDLTAALAHIGESVGVADVAVAAVGVALREFPRVNGSYRDGRYETYPNVNVGIAVESEGATVFAAIADADTKDAATIGVQARELERAASAASLKAPQLSGTTFAITDLTESGVRAADPVINPPHAAAMTLGGVRDGVVVRDGAVVPTKVLTATLACDHRILSARQAAAFLDRFRELLEAG